MYVIFASGGNDSVALCQWVHESMHWKDGDRKEEIIVAYSNTHWASPEWPARMVKFATWVQEQGFTFTEIDSDGMDALVTRKQAFPANKPKFCTYELKILPAKKWLDAIDPRKEATCMVGVRRCESRARMEWPEYIEESDNHGGRPLWSPLVRHDDAERDALLERAGWNVLPHRSRECSPCVNANRQDFRRLSLADIDKVRRKESEMGLTMFRPYRFGGAIGIDEVMRWAWSERGKYKRDDHDGACDSGMCEL